MTYSLIEHLIGSRYLNRSKTVCNPMMSLYMDDSGTSPSQDIAIAAGWLGTLQSWKGFEKDWNKVRSIESNKFECMHMNEFVWDHGEFENWGDLDKKLRLVPKLTNIINNRSTKGFAIAVAKSEFDAIVPKTLRKQGFENHYTYAVRIVLGMIHKWLIQTHTQDLSVHYIFDHLNRSDPRRTELERVFTTIGTHDENFHNYGLTGDGISFMPRCEVSPLQAADMLAWTAFQVVRDELKLARLNPIAGSCFTEFYLHNNRRHLEAGYHTPQHLREWVREKGY